MITNCELYFHMSRNIHPVHEVRLRIYVPDVLCEGLYL